MGTLSRKQSLGIDACLAVLFILGIALAVVVTSPLWGPTTWYFHGSSIGQRHACTNAAQSAIPNAGTYALINDDFAGIRASDLGVHYWVDDDETRHGKVKVVFEEKTPTSLIIRMRPTGKLRGEHPNCNANVTIRLMENGNVVATNAVWTWG